ncbi:MAG: LysM peptidoglycan-binding domain-containing protein [Chloroflexi bacterium]|nr:LysM peptidoglycan-binding domain-containing protein [Chloroflexota bacterium]
MRTRTRHALYLVLAVGLVVVLSGCYRSMGGSLEPTPLGEPVAQVQTTPLPMPTFTPIEVEPTAEEVDEFPSPTPFPTLAPPTDTPEPTATQTAVLPDGQGGSLDTDTPEPTRTPVMVGIAPSFTPQPSGTPLPPPSSTPTAQPTNTPFVPQPSSTPVMIAAVPSNTPVVVAVVLTNTPYVPPTTIIMPSATFTSVPFRTLAPSPTYTPFMPPTTPMGVAFVPTFTPAFIEAQPLAERPTDTAVAPLAPVATTDPALGFVTPMPTAQMVAQGPTLSPFQMTATVMVWEATATSAAALGVQYPTLTPMGMVGQQPVVVPGAGTPLPPNVIYITATPLGQAGICSQHSVQVNETLYRIAAQYGVTTQQIAQANNITNPDLILMGATLQIPCPVPSTPTPIAPQQPQQPQTTTGQGGLSGNIYVVQAGDNIYRLSVRFGVTMQELMAANGMSAATSQMIYVGQELIVPPSSTVVATPIPTPFAGQPTPVYIVITATPGGPIG